MTHDIKGCLVEAVEFLEETEDGHLFADHPEQSKRIITKLRALIEQVPDGLDDDIDVLENTYDGQAKLRKCRDILLEATETDK